MTITLDDSLIADENLSYRETSSSPYVLSVPSDSGLHTVVAKVYPDGITQEKIINLGDSITNLFVSYVYHASTPKEAEIDRKYFHETKDSSLVFFTEPPRVILHVIKGKIKIH